MKILFITPSPPNDLNRIRSKNIIMALSKLGHEVFLVSLIKNKKELDSLNLIKPYVKDFVAIKQPIWLSIFWCIFGLVLPIPLRVAYCYSRKLKKELGQDKYNDFDFIYIKRLRMAQYASLFKDKKRIFIDLTDSMTKYYERLKVVEVGWRKVLAWEEYLKHKLYEPKICQKFNHFLICSKEDRDYLVYNFGCISDKFYVLENGINTEEWQHTSNSVSLNLNKLIFWGVMNVETNILSCIFFIKKVLPLLNDNFSFTIIGPKPGPELTKYQNERIMFLGYVDNLQQNINGGIFVCPIVTGAGVKNKIIQASLIGLPIISTSLGVEGAEEELKRGIFIANSPAEFVEKINQILLMDSNVLQELSNRQAELVLEHYDIYKLVKEFMYISFYDK